MNVDQLWVYPVKSMMGSTVDSIELSTLGIVGDRHWAIRDLERGGIRGAKKIGELMQLTAERDGDAVRIGFPDGSTASQVTMNCLLQSKQSSPLTSIHHLRLTAVSSPSLVMTGKASHTSQWAAVATVAP